MASDYLEYVANAIPVGVIEAIAVAVVAGVRVGAVTRVGG